MYSTISYSTTTEELYLRKGAAVIELSSHERVRVLVDATDGTFNIQDSYTQNTIMRLNNTLPIGMDYWKRPEDSVVRVKRVNLVAFSTRPGIRCLLGWDASSFTIIISLEERKHDAETLNQLRERIRELAEYSIVLWKFYKLINTVVKELTNEGKK